MNVKQARISNWKSFEHRKNPEWIKFKGLNIIIGANSHGKTNFANALRLVLFGGPDYGGQPRKEIAKSDCHDPDKPINFEVELEVDGDDVKIKYEKFYSEFDKLIKSKSIPDKRIQGRFFPVGQRQQVHLLGHQNAFALQTKTNAEVFQEKWQMIRDEMSKYFNVKLPKEPPAKPNPPILNYFSDITDKNGQRFSESGSGHMAALYLVLEIRKHEQKCKVFLIEEPENHMHPSLLRKFLNYLIWLNKKHDLQFFVITHSATLIDNSILPRDDTSILHVKMDNNKSTITNVTDNLNAKWKLIYDQLGYRPSDILFTNTIIWVEGPSDAIYLKKWMSDMNSQLKEGVDFCIMWYGGSLLKHASFANKNEFDALVELANINRNGAILMDRDVNDLRKKRIQKSFDRVGNPVWITKGKEIENYIRKDRFEQAVRKVHPRSGKTYNIPTNDPNRMRTVLPNKNSIDKISVAKLLTQQETDYDILDLENQVSQLVDWILKKRGLQPESK